MNCALLRFGLVSASATAGSLLVFSTQPTRPGHQTRTIPVSIWKFDAWQKTVDVVFRKEKTRP